MADVELHVKLSIVIDEPVWRDAYFISEKGLAGDVPEYVERTVKDSAAAHFEHAIKSVETLSVEEIT